MKKFLAAVLLISLIFSCSISVDAAVITRNNNTDESTALTVNMGDTIVVDGWLPSGGAYYKIDVPYTSAVTCKVQSQKTGGSSYIVSAKFNMNFDSFKSSQNLRYNAGTTVKYNTVYPGSYYFVVSPRDDCLGYFRLTFEFEFECLHVDTEEKITSQATCSSLGEKQEICSECKDVLSIEKIDKLPHTPADEWTTTKETSCAADGEKVLYCEVCEETLETEVVEALPHTYGDWKIDKETSCSKPGERSRVCEECKYVDKEEIEQLDHTFGNWNVEVEATCANKGKRSRVCSVCGHEEREDIEALPHDYSVWETTEEATCTAKGERKRICENCGYEDTEAIALKDHKFGKWNTVAEPTESTAGKRERTCSVCNETEEETLKKLIHGDEYEWKVTNEATCTTNGTKTKICSYCDRTMETKTITATGHEFTEWFVTVDPTKNSDGVEKRICEICEKTESRSVSLKHGSYGEWKITKEATCTESGTKSFVCACCNKVTDTKSIAKTSHKYGEWTTKDKAYPEKDGREERVCSGCGAAENNVIKYDFAERKNQKEGKHPFSDVSDEKWYKDVVGKCYHYGLMIGNSETTFNPTGNITLAEVITAAVRMYCLENENVKKPVIGGEVWYKGYVDYAIEKGIIKKDDFSDYSVPATRAQMAYIFSSCVSEDSLKKINNYESLPDVAKDHKYSKEIFALYNAGILNGNDEQGTFMPEKEIVRAEVAAIIARISQISERIKK